MLFGLRRFIPLLQSIHPFENDKNAPFFVLPDQAPWLHLAENLVRPYWIKVN